MNVNMRELENHIEFEPNTYYASFSAELELSASPMWAILAHLKAKHHLPVLYRILKAVSTLFIFYKNVIFFLKPWKEIEIATSKITTMFLIFKQFQGLMFL